MHGLTKLWLSNSRNYKEAIICANEGLHINSNNVYLQNIKCIAVARSGNNKKSIACYNKAIEIDPNFIVIACYNKANALYYLKYYDQAIECYGKAVKVECAGSETDPINIIRIKAWLSKIKDMIIKELHEMSGE